MNDYRAAILNTFTYLGMPRSDRLASCIRCMKQRGKKGESCRNFATKPNGILVITNSAPKPRHCDRHLYQTRHLIENFFAKLKQFRTIATRYDKTARNFLGAIYYPEKTPGSAGVTVAV